MDVRFDWDRAKDRKNQRRHAVSFAEARSVFFDENGICGVFVGYIHELRT